MGGALQAHQPSPPKVRPEQQTPPPGIRHLQLCLCGAAIGLPHKGGVWGCSFCFNGSFALTPPLPSHDQPDSGPRVRGEHRPDVLLGQRLCLRRLCPGAGGSHSGRLRRRWASSRTPGAGLQSKGRLPTLLCSGHGCEWPPESPLPLPPPGPDGSDPPGSKTLPQGYLYSFIYSSLVLLLCLLVCLVGAHIYSRAAFFIFLLVNLVLVTIFVSFFTVSPRLIAVSHGDNQTFNASFTGFNISTLRDNMYGRGASPAWPGGGGASAGVQPWHFLGGVEGLWQLGRGCPVPIQTDRWPS